MRKIGPVLLNKLKSHFRHRNIIVNTSLIDEKEIIHFVKKKDMHLKGPLINIVKEGISRFWSGYVILEDSPVEISIWSNPGHVIVIHDRPSVAFKIGTHWQDISHEYSCHIEHNPALSHIIIVFKDDLQAYEFRKRFMQEATSFRFG